MISERKARILYLFLCTFGKNFLCLASIRSRPFFSLHCITSAFIKSHQQQIQSPVHGKPFKATLCSSASGWAFAFCTTRLVSHIHAFLTQQLFKDQAALLNSLILLPVCSLMGEQINKRVMYSSNFDMPNSKMAYTNPPRTYAKEQNCNQTLPFWERSHCLPGWDNQAPVLRKVPIAPPSGDPNKPQSPNCS